VPIEVLCKIGTGVPDIVRVWIDCCEDIEQVLDIYILRGDPPRFSEVGLVRIKRN
jgi:hypothetical protein